MFELPVADAVSFRREREVFYLTTLSIAVVIVVSEE